MLLPAWQAGPLTVRWTCRHEGSGLSSTDLHRWSKAGIVESAESSQCVKVIMSRAALAYCWHARSKLTALIVSMDGVCCMSSMCILYTEYV